MTVAAAAAAAESGDQFSGETKYQRDVRQLAELFSKLNPSAKEFVPAAARKPDPRLSADAPSFDFQSNGSVKDSSSDGSSNNQQSNRRRRNGFSQGRRKMYDSDSKEKKIRRTVYVSDISQNVTEEGLASIFNYCGTVVECRVCGDPRSPLRFAFIEFSKESEARAALNLGGAVIDYCQLRVLPSKTAIVPVNPKFLPQSEGEREMVGRTVYCTNIDKQVTQTEIKAFFEQYCGEVKRLRLLLDNKHSTCIAFVEFAEAASAVVALSYSGAPLGALPIRVSPSKTPVRPRYPRAMMH